MHNHPVCRLNEMSDQRIKRLPKRLLELERLEDKLSARLVHTEESDLGSEVPYVTLSHCWGSLQIPKLRLDNISELAAGLTVSSLPKTFQDAIKMTLWFGVKYLWIDSLCIIQDSTDDWVQEASVMGSIYANGLCNLAATSAADGNGGLFHTGPTTLQDFHLKTSWDNRANGLYWIYPTHFEYPQLFEEPLMQRGWVVQERIMSRRVLHFGQQLFWECLQKAACETYPSGFPRMYDRYNLNLFKPDYQRLDTVSESLDAGESRALDMLQIWHDVVRSYGSCDLTRKEDKLVAISGLAKAFLKGMRLEGSDYLAGLWRMNLLHDLCWYGYAGRTRSQQYRAPSWSWASVDGKGAIDRAYTKDHREAITKILEASVELLGDDSTGQVKGGFVRLRGPLMTMDYKKGPTSSPYDSEDHSKINGIWHNTWGIHKDIPATSQKWHCMPLMWVKQASTSESVEDILEETTVQDAQCLVLQSTGVQKGQFQRIGLYRSCEIEEVYQIKSWDSVKNDDWLEFEEDMGDGTYIISVV
jgi:hypothetical protein